MKVKRLKINRIIALIIILALIIGGTSWIIKNISYKKSYEYKLEQLGYSESEVKDLKELFKSEELDQILELDYSPAIIDFASEEYFIFDNLKEYIDYYFENKSVSYDKIIALVNTEAYKGWYKDIKDTDLSKENLMLVNKFNSLSEDYEPEDLTLVSSQYAYSEKYISESIYEALIEMLTAAKAEGYSIVITQGYRSYSDQEEAYNSYRDYHTEEEADLFAARAGHSDYQTGLSVLLVPYNKTVEDEKTSEEFNWLIDNAYRYGFILRFPEDKEDITGFAYEPWRYRYVGEEVAEYIHENDITFDEYYAYFED